MFHSNLWNLPKKFKTALFWAIKNGYLEIVKLLIENEKIDINIKDIYLFYLEYIFMNWYFKIIFGIYYEYLRRHL